MFEVVIVEMNVLLVVVGELFDWFSVWYFFCLVSFLDVNESNELRVFGKKFVVYFDLMCKEW